MTSPTTPTTTAHPDRRSVGELLLDADSLSRSLLWDAAPDNARQLTRGFGEVIDAAARLWSAIPDRTADPSMRRIHTLTRSLHRTHTRRGWPGPGPTHPLLEEVAATLERAAERVEARSFPATVSEAGHLDAEAARTRIMHIVQVSSHAVALALRRHVAELRHRLDSGRTIPPGESIRRARDSQGRISNLERIAADYLEPRWPAMLHGEHREPPAPDRLTLALAQWDLAAHRSLAGPPTVGNMEWIARVHRDVSLATGIIGDAATKNGALEAWHHTRRVMPALAALAHDWEKLAAHLAAGSGNRRRVDPTLLAAGSELRAALHEITHVGAGLASPAVITSRADVVAATQALHHALASGPSLTLLLRDSIEDPQLTMPARGAHTLAAASGQETSQRAWVDAHDQRRNVEVPLPAQARQVLLASTRQLTHDTTRAATAVASTTTGPHTAPPAPQAPRTRAQPTPPRLAAPVPGYRCER